MEQNSSNLRLYCNESIFRLRCHGHDPIKLYLLGYDRNRRRGWVSIMIFVDFVHCIRLQLNLNDCTFKCAVCWDRSIIHSFNCSYIYINVVFCVVRFTFSDTYFWRFIHVKWLSKLLPKGSFWINTHISVIPGIGLTSLWLRADMQQLAWKWVIWLVFVHFVCLGRSKLCL